ncbi:MAG: heme-binding protein [Mailhella sp.]|jgi:uncharacterized protein GlcG (DUF336 family)|nr:heme-binding protein [Mailhella sp.]
MIARKKIVEAIVRLEELAGEGSPVSLCITDEHGFVLGYTQMEGASSRSFTMARSKACTAARMGVSTAKFHERLVREQLTLTDFGEAHFTTVQGGVPVITADGIVIGGVAVSGRAPQEDEALAISFAALLV